MTRDWQEMIDTWQIGVFKTWTEDLGSGLDFEGVALEALKCTIHMMEVALMFPEWGKAFIALSEGGNLAPVEERYTAALALVQKYPVKIRDDAGEV